MRRKSWPILRCYPGMSLDRLKENNEKLSQKSQELSQGLN
jgi:hypothetical protein